MEPNTSPCDISQTEISGASLRLFVFAPRHHARLDHLLNVALQIGPRRLIHRFQRHLDMAAFEEKERHFRQRVADCDRFNVGGFFAAGVVGREDAVFADGELEEDVFVFEFVPDCAVNAEGIALSSAERDR